MDYFLPQQTINVEEVLSLNDETILKQNITMDDFVQNFKTQSGLDKISSFSSSDSLPDILSGMVSKMFQTTGIASTDLKYIICGNPCLMEDNISAVHYIHKKYNVVNASIIPIFQPCASSVIAMGIAGLAGEDKKRYRK